MRLMDKVAVITASASGMGKAGALLFAKEGAKVAVVDINEAGGREVVGEIKRNGGEAIFVRADLSNINNIEKVIQTVDNHYKQLNILWNHAGTPGPKGIIGVTEKEFDFAIDLNLKSGFFMTQQAIPIMEKSGGGSIIFTASASGLKASPLSPVYSAAKGAIVNLIRSLAVALSDKGIRVNSICPGLIETPMMDQFLMRTENDDREKNMRLFTDNIPAGRLGQPEDIASAALFLASDEADYITGINLSVDGGYMAK